MFTNNLNPIAFSFGIISIHWYGIMYVLGLLFTYWFAKRAIKQNRLELTEDQLESILVWAVAGMILGARLFEVLFWEPAYFFSHPLEILKFWNGGLSFHGGMLGALTSAFLWCRKNNKKFLSLIEVFLVPIALGFSFGRIGNFFNSELYGKITTLPWGVYFQNAEGARHPTQLYEALYGAAIFSILYLIYKKKPSAGKILGWFLILFAVFRTLTEFLRVGEPALFWLTYAQWFNIPMLLIGLWLLLRKLSR